MTTKSLTATILRELEHKVVEDMRTHHSCYDQHDYDRQVEYDLECFARFIVDEYWKKRDEYR